ncbi:hypothetical protein QBC43DRAFT_207925 [Cladorrhinum sp. PSN259]|nr:hypothetical protein QBC43DRAFT_207925 [Cladorrhinum sp. PSN259]
MPPKLISNQALSTVENIALLSLLNRTPTLPGDNVRQISHSKQDVSRILSFDCEISLTSTLAFLSGVSDDPGHVVAVCVEELIDSSGLRVLVAINKKNPESGIGVLGRIEEGLGKIFGYLSRAGCSAKNNVSLETQVLAAILDMCERRIFSRIRSKRFESRYSKKDKPSFTTVIKDVLEVVNRNRGKKRVLPEVKGFIDTTTKLAKLLDRLEVCQTKDVRSCLEDILKAASELAENTIFDNIFSGATSVELATSTKLDFINRLSRLARYYQCPGFLVKLAKRSGLFKKTTITTVALDAKYFTRCMTGTAGCSLAGCLDRCQTGTFPPFGVKGISRRLGKNQTEANTAFQNAIAETLSESKIHAEVQIIAFYELYKVPRKPRVICSSKDACYLCHQFVRLHGLFHIPKTHGNLYTRWRVPPVPSLGPLKDMLEESLGAQIRKEIQAFQTDPERKTKYTKHENESSIFPFAQLMSSLDSIPTPSEDPANKIVTKKTIKKNAEQQSASGLVATLPEVPQPQLMSPAPSCAQEQLQQITPSPAAPERTANSEESYSQTGSQQKSEQKQIFQPLKRLVHSLVSCWPVAIRGRSRTRGHHYIRTSS